MGLIQLFFVCCICS